MKKRFLIVLPVIIILLAGVFLIANFLYERKTKSENWPKEYTNMLMMQIMLALKNSNRSNLYALYISKDVDAGLLVSPFTPEDIYEKYHDKFVNHEINDRGLFEIICGYKLKRNPQTGLYEMWDKCKPELKLQEEKITSKSKEYYNNSGFAFKMYGIPKNSDLRNKFPKECFGD